MVPSVMHVDEALIFVSQTVRHLKKLIIRSSSRLARWLFVRWRLARRRLVRRLCTRRRFSGRFIWRFMAGGTSPSGISNTVCVGAYFFKGDDTSCILTAYKPGKILYTSRTFKC
jgi:hypothetical protein